MHVVAYSHSIGAECLVHGQKPLLWLDAKILNGKRVIF